MTQGFRLGGTLEVSGIKPIPQSKVNLDQPIRKMEDFAKCRLMLIRKMHLGPSCPNNIHNASHKQNKMCLKNSVHS